MINPYSLEEKTIVVTGATSGIGNEIAIQVANMGANVVLIGRNETALGSTLSQLRGQGHTKYLCDLTDSDQLLNLVDALNKIDGLVHCAGSIELLPMKKVNKAKLSQLLSINYIAPFLFTSELLRKNKFNDNSSVVFITSINGTDIGVQGFTNYAGTKGAISGAVKSMALELAPKIRVNCVSPGMIETPMSSKIESLIGKKNMDDDRHSYPMGSYGSAADVAFAAIYLLSDASKWVTGTNLRVDGGISIK